MVQFVVKADDFLLDGISRSWRYFLDMSVSHGIPVLLGIVGSRIKKYSGEVRPEYVAGNEIFAHGYYHFVNRKGVSEYSGTGLPFQYDSIMKTLKTAKEVLGIDIKTFGAPGNMTDDCTGQALDKIPEIENVLYKPITASKRLLERNFEFEYRFNFDRFHQEMYAINHLVWKVFQVGFQNSPLRVLEERFLEVVLNNSTIICGQIHPAWWSVHQLHGLEHFFSYLRDHNVRIITARDIQ